MPSLVNLAGRKLISEVLAAEGPDSEGGVGVTRTPPGSTTIRGLAEGVRESPGLGNLTESSSEAALEGTPLRPATKG